MPPASRPASRSWRRPSRSRPSGSSARACPAGREKARWRVRAVGQPVVDLVAVDEEVVADGDRRDLVLDLGRAGRRRSGCTGSRGRSPSSAGVIAASSAAGSSAKSSSKRVGTWTDDAAGEDDRGHVRHVRGLVEDDLVTGIAGGAKGEVDRLRGAHGDQQLGRAGRSARCSGARDAGEGRRSSTVP